MNTINNDEMYCIVSETENISIELIKPYFYIVQQNDAFSLKIWYEDMLTHKIKMILVIVDENQISSCVDALGTLICKKGYLGLDYTDIFKYMGDDASSCYFSEYSIQISNDKQRVVDFEKLQELCKKAKSCVLLFVGCSLWYASDIVELLDGDDIEIAYQVHDDGNENRCDGKLYLWVRL